MAWIGAATAWVSALCVLPADVSAQSQEVQPYRVVEGAVDRATYNGYRRYHATCSHCHGPDGIGSTFGPSLIEAPLGRGAFRAVVLHGRARGTSVMRGFAGDPNVVDHIDDIYAYLLARADGALGRGRPERIH